MRWNDSGIAFSRPIRWLTALFDEAIIPFEYAAVPSNNKTQGIRPFGSPEITVKSLDAYFEAVKSQGIILNHEKRRDTIREQVNELAKKAGGRVPDDPGLLDEVTNLVEAPTALVGHFEEKYLELPREVLVTVMRKHQRYFPVEDAQGRLLPYFITVRNGDDQHLDMVAHGNEQVIKARFSDAAFFYHEDLKKPLQDYLPRLSTLTFQKQLGSMMDKNERVAELVEPLSKLLHMASTDVV